MATFISGVFLILHGFVHLLYFGHVRRRFELRPGMVWPDGSWAFSRPLGDQAARQVVCVALVLVAAGFAAGGLGLLIGQAWWRSVAAGAAVLSIATFVLSWDGKLAALDQQGAVALLINLAILSAALLLGWPV